jgi:hypothetical protein
LKKEELELNGTLQPLVCADDATFDVMTAVEI